VTWWVDWPKALLVAAISWPPLVVLFTLGQILGERVGDHAGAALARRFKPRAVPPEAPGVPMLTYHMERKRP
jgi:hypothetical protein